jgi:hypothetical protein
MRGKSDGLGTGGWGLGGRMIDEWGKAAPLSGPRSFVSRSCRSLVHFVLCDARRVTANSWLDRDLRTAGP